MLFNEFSKELIKNKLYIKENKIVDIYELYKSNDYYAKVSDNYPVTMESVIDDINDIPDFIEREQKYYLSIYNQDKMLVAVVDFLDGYSFQNKNNQDALWIGLLQINQQFHRKCFGKTILESLESACKKNNKKLIQLCVIKKNVNGYNFWVKQGFKVFKEGNNKKYDLYLMEKKIGDLSDKTSYE